MAKNIENFRDELTKLAQVSEILEKSFFSKGPYGAKWLGVGRQGRC